MLRLTLAIVAGALWLAAGWLASHASESPAILGRYSPGYAVMLAAMLGTAGVLTVALWPPIFARARALLANGLLGAAAVLAALALAEAAVRLFDPLGISYYEEIRRFELRKVPDADLVYRNPAGVNEPFQGARVETNELGLRDRPLGAKPAGEWRLLVLGDSVVFGWGVKEPESFPRRLEAALGPSAGRPVRVINAGVNSYNTEQEFDFLRLHFAHLQPDLVLLVMTTNDHELHTLPFDPHRSMSLAGRSPPEVVSRLLWESWAYRLVAHVLRYHVGARAATAPDPASEGWRRSMAALEGMARYCRERGVPLVVLAYRIQSGVIGEALARDAGAAARHHGYAFEDTLPWFAGQDIRALTNSVVDVHLNAAGQRVLAEGILRALAEERLVPAPGDN